MAAGSGEPGAERSLEGVLERLEEIAARLEGDELELAESLELYEEGVRLLRTAGVILAHAEERVHALRPDADGFRVEPLEEEA
jgi:exodeoxyribonuclease VII small subunit